MEQDYLRKIIEVEALYLIEPELKDIYVEGPEEVNLLEIYLKSNEVNVISIDNVDFSGTAGEELNSNRDKVLYLNDYVVNKIDNQLPYLMFIVDRDFDTVNERMINNDYLEYTDFANLEMYLFNTDSINKFLKIGLKNFPLEADVIIDVMKNVLFDLFALRYSRDVIDKGYKMLELGKLVKLKESNFEYSKEELLTKFLSKNNALPKEELFLAEIMKVKNKYSEYNEIRLFAHGKDFIELFFLLIKKVKNTYSFNIKSFTRALFASLEINLLKQYNLFKRIDDKYLNCA